MIDNDPSWIAREILAQGGTVSGERFMELALYHPGQGYYQKEQISIGREGDYVTAPVMTSLFGELLTLQCIEVWELMKRPAPFVLIEAGPGTGHLATDILRTSRKFPEFAQSLDYRLVEIAAPLRNLQRQRLADAGFQNRCSWFDTLAAAAGTGIQGIILGNEFLDALPVCWVEMTPSGLVERGVQATAEGILSIVSIPLGRGIEPDHFSRIGLDLPVGMRTEVGYPAQKWMRQSGRLVLRGMLLMIDYGYTARDYYHSERMQGTLVGHHRHHRIDDPLKFPGEMDLTTHVDFSAMARAGAQGGWEPCGFTTQGWFFLGLGLLERLQGLMKKEGMRLSAEVSQTAMRLILPEEMGERFKVLAMTKGLNRLELSGYRLNNRWGEL
ncbi:MAG: SAM-dependent methyltransferase [Magnetococcales bacterium]|nr:SAM-dependent methyltransferase [Magnetococcales bacterium]